MKRCTRKHVVVTGASSGIGRATATRLAAAGWHVYAGVRGTAPAGTAPLTLDVTDIDQIGAAAKQVAAHTGRLDALVNNAGIGLTWPLELIPVDELRRQFEINVIGQVAVTQAFLPLLRAARGHIVMMGSIGDRLAVPFGGPVSSSKSALATLTDAWRQELAPWGIRVVLIEPASIRTGAADKVALDAERAVEQFSEEGRKLYRDSYLGMVRVFLRRERNGSPPNVVADTIATALATHRPRARYLVGRDSRMLATLARVLPVPVLDAARRRLFHLPAPDSRLST